MIHTATGSEYRLHFHPTRESGSTIQQIAEAYATRRNFYTEEEDGDVINDALGDRDRFVEERYGVDIVTISEAEAGDLKKTVEADQQAGDHSFDLLISFLRGFQ